MDPNPNSLILSTVLDSLFGAAPGYTAFFTGREGKTSDSPITHVRHYFVDNARRSEALLGVLLDADGKGRRIFVAPALFPAPTWDGTTAPGVLTYAVGKGDASREHVSQYVVLENDPEHGIRLMPWTVERADCTSRRLAAAVWLDQAEPISGCLGLMPVLGGHCPLCLCSLV